ncbi:MAG: sigma-70 family RNA polymerase sigma factor [Oscillospiraceae bacterium]|nr:sigma-70 family RNA polymerase sigma factor [Oscillospiraceae bacterium]
MTKEQELTIIRRVQHGDTEAFSLLVAEYERNVFNVALQMVGDREDAQDMAQEAFLKAYTSLSTFRGDSRFSSWLYRIVANVCLDFKRHQGRRPSNSLTVEDDDGAAVELDIPDESQSPEALLERKLTREAVRRGLKQLPDEQRQILLLREIQGLSYEEIGEAMDLEPGTVKSRIFRARKKLCAFLLQDGNIPDSISSSKTRGSDEP